MGDKIPLSASSLTNSFHPSFYRHCDYYSKFTNTTTYSPQHPRPPLPPIITSKFRRFVAKVGPVFWIQERIEGVVLRKKGWKRTTVFLATYGFLCACTSFRSVLVARWMYPCKGYFPRIPLLIPHSLLRGVMLAVILIPEYLPSPSTLAKGQLIGRLTSRPFRAPCECVPSSYLSTGIHGRHMLMGHVDVRHTRFHRPSSPSTRTPTTDTTVTTITTTTRGHYTISGT